MRTPSGSTHCTENTGTSCPRGESGSSHRKSKLPCILITEIDFECSYEGNYHHYRIVPQLKRHGLSPPGPTPSCQYCVCTGVNSMTGAGGGMAVLLLMPLIGFLLWKHVVAVYVNKITVSSATSLMSYHHILVHFSITLILLIEQCLLCFFLFARI